MPSKLRFACRLAAVLACAIPAYPGPVEFGTAELNQALEQRGLKLRYFTEINSSPPECFRIRPNRISGGDLRGLMYGLLEAAAQIRETGKLTPIEGSPATPMRGIRQFLHNQDLEKDWYYSHEYWRAFFQMLARNRFNRYNLVFAHQTNYLAPPYPYWLALPEFPGVRAAGLTDRQRDNNLAMLRFIAQTAADHGIDFTLGIWEHNIQPGMTATVEGLTRENIGPYSYAALKKILAECPAIRSVQMRTNAESGIPSTQQVEFYRDWVYRAIREAGRRVVLDLRGWVMTPGMLDAATGAGVSLRISSKYWAEDLGRPYPPAETWPNYSYLNFLEKPRPWSFYWELWGLGSHRLLLWGDPDYVRRAVPTFTMAGSSGFEIDPPLAQKGFGNRPGSWGIFTAAHRDRVFWQYEFERYWLFYLLWGRLSYDPKTPESVWMSALERRFGKAAAPDVLGAYKSASGVLNEIVAVHLADPNMYIWPEINPGGLIDAYREVRPSDFRFVATVTQAVRNRLDGVASAKQTPLQTAEYLQTLALGIRDSVKRAQTKLGSSPPREWLGSETDFDVLERLASYHANKQMAADFLTTFYETSDPAYLDAAHMRLRSGARNWEELVKLTDGLYPAEMAFGPDDIGHWKDKLPYVQQDLATLEARRAVYQQFGRFVRGFDFGEAIPQPANNSYRNDHWLVHNTVDPRFQCVDPNTAYGAETGFGWAAAGKRESVPLTRIPYAEVRAVASAPKHLHQDALYGDAIHGQGPQVFRIAQAPGEYTVHLLHPDRTTTVRKLRSSEGVLDVVFPDGEWTICGVVVQSDAIGAPAPVQWPAFVPRPVFTHIPAVSVQRNTPLRLSLRTSPLKDVRSVRLHYRAVNQLAKFKTLEAPPEAAVFSIPKEDVDGRWDLQYYFEILNSENTGWFEPDPRKSTPYYAVRVE